MRRALVTGGAGFIGSHLVDSLVRRGVEVWAVDDLSTGSEANLKESVATGNAHLLVGDVRKIQNLGGLPPSFDVVFHEAAIANVQKSVDDPLLVHDVNVNAALALMNLCVDLKVRRFVFASSAAVYGTVESPPAREGAPCRPGSPYGASKFSVEGYMHAYHECYGLETVALRYFNVYGPRQRSEDSYSGVISLFTRQLLTSATPRIYGDGLQTRDFVYVGDVAEANMLAMEAPDAPGQVFNIASGRNISVVSLLDSLSRAAGAGRAVPEYAPARKGDPKEGSASIEKARRVLGYSPRVSLEDGLATVVRDIANRLGLIAA